jgi:hypothetical protein
MILAIRLWMFLVCNKFHPKMDDSYHHFMDAFSYHLFGCFWSQCITTFTYKMAVGAPIRVCVLEGLYGQLATLGFSHSIAIELQSRGLKPESAVWTMRHSSSGLSISLFWPGYRNQGCHYEVESKPRRRRRRRRRRPRSSHRPANNTSRTCFNSTVLSQTRGLPTIARHDDYSPTAGNTTTTLPSLGVLPSTLSSERALSATPPSEQDSSDLGLLQDSDSEPESPETDQSVLDSPSRYQLSQVLKDASSVNFEVRDNIPGVSYSSGTPASVQQWTPVSVKARHTPGEYDTDYLKACKSVRILQTSEKSWVAQLHKGCVKFATPIASRTRSKTINSQPP